MTKQNKTHNFIPIEIKQLQEEIENKTQKLNAQDTAGYSAPYKSGYNQALQDIQNIINNKFNN